MKPYISPEKLAANRANAQHSTGPLTEPGKARVAGNARTHGLCGKDVLLPGESKEEFFQLQQDYLVQIKPLQTGPERTLFDELVIAAWKLRRAQRLETELQSRSDDLLAQLDDDKLQKKLENLARHKTRLERTFHRSLKELKALQTNRAELMVITEAREVLPGLAVVRVFAKQTHRVPEELKLSLQADRILQQRLEAEAENIDNLTEESPHAA